MAKKKGATRRPSRAKAERAPARESGGPLVRASLAVSLDGYIADAEGGADWLHPYFSDEIDFGAFMRTIGVTIMGRRTYEFAQRMHGGGAAKPGRAAAGAEPTTDAGAIGAVSTVVHTRRALDTPQKDAAAYCGDPAALAGALKRRLAGTGQDIWHMGGGESLDAFRAAGCIDRWELAVMPVLLGAGTPLFPRHSRGPEGLRLVKHRALTNGVVEAWYEPAPDAR